MTLSPFIWPKSPLDPPLGLCSETRNAFLFPKLCLPFLEGLCSFVLNRADRGACVYPSQIQSRIYESWAGFSCYLYHREIICWFHLVNKAAGWSLPFPSPAEIMWSQCWCDNAETNEQDFYWGGGLIQPSITFLVPQSEANERRYVCTLFLHLLLMHSVYYSK